MADQTGFPFRALIHELQLKTAPELTRIEALAEQIQKFRRQAGEEILEAPKAQEEVSRTSLLHARPA